jgi:hypothetical protein
MALASVLTTVPSLSQMSRSTDADTTYTPGDDIAMSHPVNVRAHGTVAGTSTVNPYLMQNVLDEDSLQNDVRYFTEL